MKKISKLLLVILSVLALVALTAFAISAADETVEGTFAVRDADGTLKGYTDWNAAVEAAKTAGNYTITLNDNWTISESADLYGPKGVQGYSGMYTADDGAGYKIVNDSHDAGVNLSEKTSIGTNFYTFQDGKNWTLDLNGKTVNVDMDGLLFYLYNTKLTITGGGTINNARQIVRAHKNSEFTIDATSPLVINPIGHKTETTTDADGKSTTTVKQQGRWVLFNAIDDTTVLNFKGKITFNPCDSGMLYIHASGAKEVNFDSAVITVAKPSRPVKVPKSESDSTLVDNPDLVTKSLSTFIEADDTGLADVNIINGSRIDFKYGRFFNFSRKAVVSADLTGWLNPFPVVKENATISTAMSNSIDAIIEAYETNGLTINASDSDIIVDPCNEYNANIDRQQGRFITTYGGLVKGNFTNCNISAGGWSFYGDELYCGTYYPNTTNKDDGSVVTYGNNSKEVGEDYKYLAGANQFRFKDCEFERIAGGKDAGNLFIYGMNVIWEGGKIDNGGNASISVCNYFYDWPDPEKNWFYGVKISDTVIDGNISLTETPADTTAKYDSSWKNFFSTGEGENVYKNYKTLVNGHLVNHPTYITSVAPTVNTDGFLNYYSMVGEFADYNQKTGGTNDFGSILKGSGDGILSEEMLPNGNVIAQISFAEDLGDSYYELNPGGDNRGSLKNKYTILSFDIATNKETLSRELSPADRTIWPQFRKNTDNKVTYLGTTYSTSGSGDLYFYTTPGAYKLEDLPGNGVWTKVTVVEEWRVGDTITKKAIPSYAEKGATISDGNTVEVDCVQIEVIYHWYIDGVYQTKTSRYMGYNVDGEKWMPIATTVDSKAPDLYTNTYIYQDGIRIDWTSTDKTEKIYFDNITFASIPRGSSIDLSDYIGSGKNINNAPLGTSGLTVNSIPSIKSYDPAGAVNGTNYETEPELVAALDAADGYTELELKADIASKLNITGKNLLIKDNGFAFKAVSESTKVLDYTASLDGYRTALASESEIFDILFDYTDASGKAYESQTVTAALGTYVPVPGIYDPASPDFAVTVAENTSAEKVTFDYLRAWKIGDSEDLIAKAGVTEATPIIDKVKASYVHWDTNGKAEGGVVTKYYNPKLVTAIPDADIQKYVGEGYEEVKHESGWYKTAVEFKQDDITSANLSVAGAEYTISTETVKHPWVEMYANATLRTHFRFNYYVPPVVDGITNVTVTDSDGDSLHGYGTSTIPYDEQNRTWNVYSLLIAATDTTDFEVNVTYHVAGEDAPFTFTVNYGMPSYVNSVMKNESHGKTAKRLIMNIVNYADQMMTATGVTQVADTTGKLKTYKQLITEYGTEYLDLHNKLDDKRFQTGGDIHDAEVATLTNNVVNSKYIDKVSIRYTAYEPQFLLRYNTTAESLGIRVPSNNAGGLSWGDSAATISVQMKVQSSSAFPVHHILGYTDTTGEYKYIANKGHVAWTDQAANAASYDYLVWCITTYEDISDNSTGNWKPYSSLPTLSDYAGKITFQIYKDKVVDDTCEYSIAAYVSALIDLKVKETNETQKAKIQTEIDLAKSLYSLAHAAYDYKGKY